MKDNVGMMFRGLISQYCEVFISVATLVFDLAPYLEYLPEFKNQEKNSQIRNLFSTEADNAGDDQIRRARILLNKAKLERMLGWTKGSKPYAEQLLKLYLEYAKLDGKPEKGERKIADDFILIVDEVL